MKINSQIVNSRLSIEYIGQLKIIEYIVQLFETKLRGTNVRKWEFNTT